MNVTIDGQEVDMDAGDLPGFTYSINDPLKPGTVSGTRSTTFKMPATNRVRALLGGAAMSERPPLDRATLRIAKGGSIYVEQTVKPIEWDRDEVRAVTVGNNAGWINDLKGIKLPEMDLGESPRITVPTIIATWFDAAEDELLYFPMIDYGYPWNAAIAADVVDFRPGLRCHKLLEKAFDSLGYSLVIEGDLRNIWKKYVLPCTEEKIQVGQSSIDQNSMQVGSSTLQQYTTPAVIPGGLYDTLTDPGSHLAGGLSYEADVDSKMKVDVQITIGPNNANTTIQFYIYDNVANVAMSSGYTVFVPALEVVTKSFSLGEIDIVAGQQIVVVGIPDTGSFYASNAVSTYTLLNFEYQENITIDMASAAPKISAWDVLMGINYSRLLAFDTDDRTKTVTISYDRDKYRTIAEGRSLVGREDTTAPCVKGDPLLPSRIVYEWKDDADDYYLDIANTSAGPRGFGGAIREIEGGTLQEIKVQMPFAATAMHVYEGNLFIPVMREQAVRAAVVGEEDRNFKRTPRLLIADGTALCETDGWTFETAPFSIYPKCFFVYPGEVDLTMSFSPETIYGTSGPGTLALTHGAYLRRLEESKTLSIDLMLYDDELNTLDFGVPVEINDGYGSGWYYFTEVKRKRFGADEPTRCELIQV